jgi:hypothetical protein
LAVAKDMTETPWSAHNYLPVCVAGSPYGQPGSSSLDWHPVRRTTLNIVPIYLLLARPGASGLRLQISFKPGAVGYDVIRRVYRMKMLFY